MLKLLVAIKNQFNAVVNMLYHVESDFEFTDEMKEVVTTTTTTERPTTFRAVLKHYNNNASDMLCVVRRKRGLFIRLW